MATPQIEHIPVPAESLAAHTFSPLHYSDSYRIQLPPDAPTDIDALYIKMFSLSPRSWVARLMQLRNLLVTPLGLKTDAPKPSQTRQPLQIGERGGLFKLFDRTSDELLLGDDDKHLDFRVSVLHQHHNGHDWLVVTTIVRFNNALGRLYFLPVRPFHQQIVPWMMKQAFATPTDQPTISTHPI